MNHLTKEQFVMISSYFEAPEQGEGFEIRVHGRADPVR
jgi:hypothetical protein